jgi:hypothetical protein
MRRREFLKYSAGVVVVAAAGGATRLAAAQEPPVTVVDEFDYLGRHVKIVETAGGVLVVFVDGRVLAPEVLARLRNGKVVSALLPFQPQPSPRALLRELLNNDGRLFIL